MRVKTPPPPFAGCATTGAHERCRSTAATTLPVRCLAIVLVQSRFTLHGRRLDVWRGRRVHLYTNVYVSLMSHASANVSLTGQVRPEGSQLKQTQANRKQRAPTGRLHQLLLL